jgi:hypothetical protein
MSEDAINHIEELPSSTSQLDLPGINIVSFVYLSGENLFTA